MSLQSAVYGFVPTSITGCQMWLDGADPAGNGVVPANNATVSTWVDKSTNGLTVSAASSQPTYSSNIVNNLGTVDGSADNATYVRLHTQNTAYSTPSSTFTFTSWIPFTYS